MKKYIFQVAVSTVLLAALAYYVDFARVLENVSRADPVLYLVGVLLFVTTYVPSGMRWRMLARASGYSSSLWSSMKLVAISYSLNKVLPWNTGDFAKPKLAERYGEVESKSRLLGVVGMERALDASALLLIVAVSILLVAAPAFQSVVWIALPFIFGIAFAVIFSFYRPSLVRAVVPERIWEPVEEVLDGFSAASGRDLVEGFALSIWKWGTEAVVFWILAASLSIDLGIWVSALANSIISLVSALPISPAGLGPADASATGILVVSGLESASALSLVVLWRSIGVGLQGVTGAVVYSLDRP